LANKFTRKLGPKQILRIGLKWRRIWLEEVRNLVEETKTKAEGGGETNANEIASLAAFA
jgi:hypothetical protein